MSYFDDLFSTDLDFVKAASIFQELKEASAADTTSYDGNVLRVASILKQAADMEMPPASELVPEREREEQALQEQRQVANEADYFRNQLRAAEEDLKQISMENLDLQKAMSELQAENEQLRLKAQELEGQLQQMQGQAMQLQAQGVAAQQQAMDANEQLMANKQTVQSYRDQILELASQDPTAPVAMAAPMPQGAPQGMVPPAGAQGMPPGQGRQAGAQQGGQAAAMGGAVPQGAMQAQSQSAQGQPGGTGGGGGKGKTSRAIMAFLRHYR